MIPAAYRNMDSYPYHRNQIPFPHYCHPAMEPVPPQMTKSPIPYEQPWPYTNSYAPHFCYGHNNFPGYNGYIPSYAHSPHVPSPSPMYYSGGCPSFFGPYSPQSHYNMEFPRYEYDKYMPREDHCCGCPNHLCNQKEEKSVKIEEKKLDVGKKENDAMVPVQFRNFPYPLVWIPPEYYSNKQPENFTTAEVDEHDKMSHDNKLNVDVHPKDEPRMWNGLFPFDVKGDPKMFRDGDGIRSLKKETDGNKEEAENGRMEQKHQSEQKRSEFPFPFFWFPYYNNQEEEGGRTKSDDVKLPNRSVSDVKEKGNNQKSIPVKQIESNHEKNDLHGSEKREMNVAKENVTKRDSHLMSKRRPTSPSKGSKLPPVCLRVDPLPRKKKGDGNSRSPSPPASKEHTKAIACETNQIPSGDMKGSTEPNLNHNGAKAGEEVTPKVKTIQVSENKTNENKAENTPTNEGGKKERRVLSVADAAILIQAVYRGYLVRKWEPLKKLRHIAEVSKEVTYVRDRIQAFEGSSDLQNDDKQKISIGETIMRLLLKLDTIQGLHPSLREVRKSLARELVTLQEKLDSITVENAQPQTQELDAKKPVEVTPLIVQKGEHDQEQQEEKVASEKDSSEGIRDESPKDQFYKKDDDGRSESRSYVNPASNERLKPTMVLNESISKDSSPVIAADTSDSTSNLSDETDECKLKSEVIDTPSEVDKLDMTALKESPVGVNNDDISDYSASEGLNSDMHGMNELPVGVLDEDTATSEETKTSESVASEVQPENEVFIEELPVAVLDEYKATYEETNTSKSEVQVKNEVFIEELPVGLLDEDTAASEEINASETKIQGGNEVFTKELPVGLLDEDEEKSEAENFQYNTKDTQLEQSLFEEKEEEVKSSEESDCWVEIELKKDKDELKVDVLMDKEESGIGNDTNLSTPERSLDHGIKEACLEADNVANMLLNEREPEEKLAQQETKVDAELNGDMKLLEENEKLRKLMKELLEAGNEQLSVISNLTGRVKDLEKKLAKTKRSKKVKTKRHKPVTPKIFV